ncbi:hypothetical protein [Vulcanisaeta souniana]|nr:hypothetical protein [Vulcanisaeta souniana]
MAVNTTTYIIAFGGRNYLVINPVQVRGEYTVSLNSLIHDWLLTNKGANQ